MEANVHRFLPGSRMDKATWSSLSPTAQATWDSLSDEDKVKILSYSEKRKAKESGVPKKNPSKRSVHFQEGEMVANDGTDSGEEETAELEVHDTALQSAEAQLNETKSKVHPADSRRMLGRQTPSDKAKTNPTGKAFHAGIQFADDGDTCEMFDDDISLGISAADSDWGDEAQPDFQDPTQAIEEYWGDLDGQFF